ncbi:MBL fold metallo-hydrolase [Pseudonocardia broussonetiae]|uniref:MBL fold metallo-hydrolase n=1 Tax=Pseudonocardia broussonetiae TaxID=2736640 RepID=A0A6M6JNW0_9PSEU|nr:MBL fold metallo-hydrolase [Pseudonocardia broussonetiae]QJY48923.1 MBL fold metallo-hydrolase [Pseudonocardia broussonetiae]
MRAAAPEVTEVAPGVHRLALPLGIHGVPTVSAYLLHDDDGDVLVDCGVAAGGAGSGVDDPCGALTVALRAAGSALDRVRRLVVTHAHIDHFGLAGEVVRRSGGELWMHEATQLDIEKYGDPAEAVDRRELMLADHGLFGPELTASSRGLQDWMPVMPSVGWPDRLLVGGERCVAGGREWQVVPTPGHSPGHVCLWSPQDRILCSGDHLLQVVSPPVTFERGFERDPMGSYLESLERVAELEPEVVLPGHGPPFRDGARRARRIASGKRRRLDQVRELVDCRERTAVEITAVFFRGELTGAQRHFAVAEVLADLAWFEARGSMTRTRRPDGVFVWRTADQEVAP